MGAATKTVWRDKNNDQHEGWIKDGLTYTDEAATARVPVGATVQTAGGTYKMTSNGGVPTYATAKNQYAANTGSAIKAYEAAGQVQADRINSATDAAIKELNRQKKITQQNREDANREAYHAYLAASNPYGAAAEQTAKLGLANSGYSETSKMRLASDYAGQISENYRAMNEQLQGLDVQIAEAKASGQYELANMLEARAQNVMQQQMAQQSNIYSGDMQAMGQAESTRQFDEQMAENTRQFNEQMTAQKEQATAQNKWDLAMAFIENGKNASFVAETLGIPQADVNTLIAAVNAQKAASSSGSGGSGRSGSSGSSGSSGKSYVDQMLALGSDAAVKEWLIRNNFSESEKDTLMGLYEEAQGQAATQSSTGAGGGNSSQFGTAYDSVWFNTRRMSDEGKSKDEIISYIMRFVDNGLTDAGVEKIEQNLGWA